MNILITNDDGVHAEGLLNLKSELDKIANVFVVAPLVERSASGHTITLHDYLRVKKIDKNIFGCSGYPADCVVMGVKHLFQDVVIDLVISGINRGANMAQDIYYSGTVAGAREGMILKIPSIAISLAVKYNEFFQDETTSETFYSTASIFIKKFIENGGILEIKKDALLNINVPNLPYQELQGIKYTIPGFIDYPKDIEKREDTRGRAYYWIGGKKGKVEGIPESDGMAIKQKHISVSDLKLSYFLPDEFACRSKIFARFL